MDLSGVFGIIIGIGFEGFLIFTIVRAFVRQFPGWGWFLIAFFPAAALIAGLAPERDSITFVISILLFFIGLITVTIYTFLLTKRPKVENVACPQCNDEAKAIRKLRMDTVTNKKVESKFSGWILMMLGFVIVFVVVVMIFLWGFLNVSACLMVAIGLALLGKGFAIVRKRSEMVVEAVLFKCKTCKHKFNIKPEEEDQLSVG